MLSRKCIFLCFIALFLEFASCVPLSLSVGENGFQENNPGFELDQYIKFKESLNLPRPDAKEVSLILSSNSELKSSSKVDPNRVGFYLYTKVNTTTPVRLFINDTEGLYKSGYQKAHKTKFLVHGFLNHLTSDMIQDIKNNLLSLDDEEMNIIAFDWSLYTIFYVDVYMKSLSAGGIIAEFINYLVREGTKLDNIHCIGHSLGSHACGFAGNQVQGGLIDRITGLDPAQPGFDVKNMTKRLNTNDARFVDCIHTCAGTLGITEPICTADYYPNAGGNQPGCPWYDFGACSHGRSHEFFSESILSDHAFPSVSCESLNFDLDECTFKGALMGYPATDKYTGILYTKTKERAPFAFNWIDLQP